MKKIYIDIDGVLLTTKVTTQADHAIQLINFITENFECYWLTTHCKGNKQTALNYLEKYFDKPTLNRLEKIKPTNWTTLKTEAIDFNSDFFWLENFPFQSEINILESNNKKDKLITVDLNKTDELLRLMTFLAQSITN